MQKLDIEAIRRDMEMPLDDITHQSFMEKFGPTIFDFTCRMVGGFVGYKIGEHCGGYEFGVLGAYVGMMSRYYIPPKGGITMALPRLG